MIRRLFYAIFFVFGGFLFAIPKWIMMGTKGGRQRAQAVKLQKETNRLLLQQRARPAPQSNYGIRSPDGRYWWDGANWNLIPA